MSRWLLVFAFVGVALAEFLGRYWPSPLDPTHAESTFPLIALALLYPGVLLIGAWLDVEWWVANELLAHYLGVLANAALFAALGACLYRSSASSRFVRFGAPVAVWVLYSWICVEGALRSRQLLA